MGCGHSVPRLPDGRGRLLDGGPLGKKQVAFAGNVELRSSPGSLDCLGPALFVSHLLPQLLRSFPWERERTEDLQSADSIKQLPVFIDGDLKISESAAILRYLAEHKALAAYPKRNPRRRAVIDWAMDRFASCMHDDAYRTLYVALGCATVVDDPLCAGLDCTENLKEFAAVFLQDRFIGGEHLSIADYRVAPFFFAYGHPLLEKRYHVQVPARLRQFNRDFAAAVPSNDGTPTGLIGLKRRLDSAYARVKGYGGCLASAAPTEEADATVLATMNRLEGSTAGRGSIKLFGVPLSMNCTGAIMFTQHAKLGAMVECMPGEATHRPEFLAMNPFHGVPTMQDGGFCLAEPSTILRYLAQAYALEYYPEERATRARSDGAMEHFGTAMHGEAVKTIHVALGFRPEPPEVELRAAGEAASRGLVVFTERFLRDTFVGGRKLSIADFRVAPFFAAYGHPLLRERCFVTLPDRIQQFNEDFARACQASTVLREAGGCAIHELLDERQHSWAAIPSQPGSPVSCASLGIVSPTAEGIGRAFSDLHITVEPARSGCPVRCGCRYSDDL